MDETRLQQALVAAIGAAREAGQELKKHYGKIEAEAKGDSDCEAKDIVTKLDGQTEELLFKRFKEFDPEIGFHGEEMGTRKSAEVTWLVDPIDGTSHFVRGLPFCTTMIALVVDKEVVLAVIHDFVNNETYWATKGGGAFKNDERIYVSDRPLRKAVVAYETRLSKPGNIDLYMKLRASVGGMLNTINSGFEFAMVASGKLDARINKDPYGFDWDYAPGALLVKEAGGIVRNHGEQTYSYVDHNFIAANPKVYDELVSTGLFS